MGNNPVHEGAENQNVLNALKNSQELKVKVSEYPLDAKVLKSIIMATLQRYSEYVLSDYYLELKKFVQSYDQKRLNAYLQSTFSEFLREEKLELSLSNQPTASSSPQINNSSEPNLNEKPKYFDYARTFQDLDKLHESWPRSPKKHSRLIRSLMQVVEENINSPQTFFSELMDVFVNAFIQKYQACLAEYRKTSDNLKKLASMDKVFAPICEIPTARRKRSSTVKIQKSKLKGNAVTKYKQAKEDLKAFLSIYQDMLKQFMEKIYCHITKDQDFKLPKSGLERISSKFLFANSRCYWTYFELIKYYMMEEEILLKPLLSKLQTFSPSDFEISPNFCMRKAARPYEAAIASLNSLETYLNPYDKFAAIAEFRQEITKSIEDYRENEGKDDETAERADLTADDVMSIYCYCVAKSKNKNLRRNQIFIEDFVSDSELKYGEKAYYFSTFIGALNFLVTMASCPLSIDEFPPNEGEPPIF